jgi:ribosome-associated heat shock protein Hsp15
VGNGAAGQGERVSMRLDRWLWCARLYKSRTDAAEAVKGGHVKANQQRAKPAFEVKIGDCLTIQRSHEEVELVVCGMPARRGPAAEAAQHYQETAQSQVQRDRAREQRQQERLVAMPPTRGRPDKRTRRLMRNERSRALNPR